MSARLEMVCNLDLLVAGKALDLLHLETLLPLILVMVHPVCEALDPGQLAVYGKGVLGLVRVLHPVVAGLALGNFRGPHPGRGVLRPCGPFRHITDRAQQAVEG